MGSQETRGVSRFSCNKASGLEKSAQAATGGAWQGCLTLCIQGGLPGGTVPVLDLGESWHELD